MSYSLEWSAGPDMMKQIATAQRDGVVDEDHQESSTMTTARQSLSMDILLLPLDPGKTSELLLSRIPLSSHNARISVRTDIPADWYRLEIHFWDEDPHRLDHARYQPHSVAATVPDKADIWDVSSSSLILAPGLARTAQLSGIVHAREVGVWRSEEAIQVTALGPDVQEWKEFVETVSEETQQERWNSEFAARPDDMAVSQQRYQELKKTFLEQQHSRNEFRMPRPITIGASGLQDRIKSLLYGLWRPGSSATSTTAAAAAQPPIQVATFERSHFPQESFRFKDAMDVAVNRELPPDFLEEELEEMREEVEEAGAQHLRFSEQQLEWDQALKQLDGLMAVWSTVPEYIVDDDALDQDENYGAPPPGLSDLHILIEHGNDVIVPGTPMTWRANRDRTVSWQATKALASDNVLFTVELIKAVDIMEPGAESPESERKAELMTRAQLIQKSLEQPQLAILTDRIPGRWEATMVRVPSWVPSGTYQVRLKGVGDIGVQWTDVSQPFAVQSDPYLYS
ncbi:hypothetical protein BGZ98_005268 [Dissophora globulifera]|nr:hypothetical protein BGZ98_005268 [Dissophora globulifera]